MRCKIADLITEVPAAGGLAPRCEAYLWHGPEEPDIVIRPDRYRIHRYPPAMPEEHLAYMESAYQFYHQLMELDGFYIHASTVVLDGRAYLFSGHSTAGKSTHTRLWQQVFGPAAVVINDDKPALRRIGGVWHAYGTPWCGKDGINCNASAPVAGICFMKKADRNAIRRLTPKEAMARVMAQTIYKFSTVQEMDQMLGKLDLLLREVPVFELENRPEPAAAIMSRDAMSRCAEEEHK